MAIAALAITTHPLECNTTPMDADVTPAASSVPPPAPAPGASGDKRKRDLVDEISLAQNDGEWSGDGGLEEQERVVEEEAASACNMDASDAQGKQPPAMEGIDKQWQDFDVIHGFGEIEVQEEDGSWRPVEMSRHKQNKSIILHFGGEEVEGMEGDYALSSGGVLTAGGDKIEFRQRTSLFLRPGESYSLTDGITVVLAPTNANVAPPAASLMPPPPTAPGASGDNKAVVAMLPIAYHIDKRSREQRQNDDSDGDAGDDGEWSPNDGSNGDAGDDGDLSDDGDLCDDCFSQDGQEQEELDDGLEDEDSEAEKEEEGSAASTCTVNASDASGHAEEAAGTVREAQAHSSAAAPLTTCHSPVNVTRPSKAALKSTWLYRGAQSPNSTAVYDDDESMPDPQRLSSTSGALESRHTSTSAATSASTKIALLPDDMKEAMHANGTYQQPRKRNPYLQAPIGPHTPRDVYQVPGDAALLRVGNRGWYVGTWSLKDAQFIVGLNQKSARAIGPSSYKLTMDAHNISYEGVVTQKMTTDEKKLALRKHLADWIRCNGTDRKPTSTLPLRIADRAPDNTLYQPHTANTTTGRQTATKRAESAVRLPSSSTNEKASRTAGPKGTTRTEIAPHAYIHRHIPDILKPQTLAILSVGCSLATGLSAPVKKVFKDSSLVSDILQFLSPTGFFQFRDEHSTHVERGANEAVQVDGIGVGKEATTRHEPATRAAPGFTGYVDRVTDQNKPLSCVSAGRPGWQKRWSEIKAKTGHDGGRVHAWLDCVPETEDGEKRKIPCTGAEDFIKILALALTGKAKLINTTDHDEITVLLFGVSSFHAAHPTRKTAEQARHVRAVKQDLGDIAMEEVATAIGLGENTVYLDGSLGWKPVMVPVIEGFTMDITEELYKKGPRSWNDNFEEQTGRHIVSCGGEATSVDLIRIFRVVWYVLFGEEYKGTQDGGDTGLHEAVIVSRKDYYYLKKVAQREGTRRPTALTKLLKGSKRSGYGSR
jgi:hypothetical protein